jgi:hydrogenase-4 membrane subunit HyfE
MVLMILNLVLIAAIFWGNPFDFKYTAQYIPYGLLAIGVLMAIVALIKSFQSFNVDINSMSLENFLTKTLYEYDKNRKIETWFGRIILSAGLLTALSFLPKKLENKDLWQALAETAFSVLITLIIYFIAFKAGAFKNRKKEGFENDLKEWNELKGIAVDLKE